MVDFVTMIFQTPAWGVDLSYLIFKSSQHGQNVSSQNNSDSIICFISFNSVTTTHSSKPQIEHLPAYKMVVDQVSMMNVDLNFPKMFLNPLVYVVT
jgi:hypothetical protein